MIIREYKDTDEEGWVRCRVISFLDCSYFNDVKREKEQYSNPSVCLVAEDNNRIVGLIDVELDSPDLSCANDERGAIIWHMAVLPEYRQKGVAKELWKKAKEAILKNGIHYCELWTQEDVAANRFYQSIGFQIVQSQCWLRCYAEGKKCSELLDNNAIGEIFGPEELIFDAPIDRKEELRNFCYRMDEVRLYACRLDYKKEGSV